MTIADIEDRNDLVLVTNSQDTEQVYYQLGMPPRKDRSLFVKVGDGECEEVYEFDGIVPYLHKELTQLK
jgi:hypothetical protein